MLRRARITRRDDALAIGLGFAVVVHAFIIALLFGWGFGLGDRGAAGAHHHAGTDGNVAALVDDAPDPELKPTCAGDVALATIGRAAMCFAPWRGDAETCQHDAEMSFYMDLSSCSGARDTSTAVAMLEQKTIEKLKPLDAEKLLEDFKPPTPTPTPPPMPVLAQQQPTPPPPPPQPSVQRPHQVVETAKPNQEDKEPENARYLAEYNTRAEKNKVARGAVDEKMVAKSKPKELKPTEQPKDDPSVQKPPKDERPGKNDNAPPVPGTLSMRKPGPNSPQAREQQDQKTRGSSVGARGPEVAEGYMQRRGNGSIEQERRQHDEQPRGDNGAGGGAPPVPNLKPTKEQLERALGGGNVDHVDDADNGDETALNAKRWVYASFFNRLKRQVAQNWDPASTWHRVDPNGAVYGFKTRITEVRVSLSPTGALAHIVVTSPSGVGELDDEAVRAFKSAAPFPNAPEGLVKDGLITFAFSFYFEIGQPRSAWRVVRTY